MAIDPRIPLAAGQIESPLLGLGRGIQQGAQMAAKKQAMQLAAQKQAADLAAQQQAMDLRQQEVDAAEAASQRQMARAELQKRRQALLGGVNALEQISVIGPDGQIDEAATQAKRRAMLPNLVSGIQQNYGYDLSEGLDDFDVSTQGLNSLRGMLGEDMFERDIKRQTLEGAQEDRAIRREKLQYDLAKTIADLKNKDMLEPKDIAGINDKVTKLTEPANEIYQSALDLQALKTSGSPAAKLAAVFKFMKALDPGSVVRTDEQGQVTAVSGLFPGFANKISQAFGGGAFDEGTFTDLVNTAETLANSNIESTRESLSQYLEPIADNMTQKQRASLEARLPSLFGDSKPTPKQRMRVPDPVYQQLIDSMTDEQYAEFERLR